MIVNVLLGEPLYISCASLDKQIMVVGILLTRNPVQSVFRIQVLPYDSGDLGPQAESDCVYVLEQLLVFAQHRIQKLCYTFGDERQVLNSRIVCFQRSSVILIVYSDYIMHSHCEIR